MKAIESWHEVVKRRDFSLLTALLADDVVFYSPVVHTPQIGKEITFIYLKAAAEVFNSPTFSYTNELISGNKASLEFKLELEGIEINGLDLITWNDDHKIVEFKVFIRPLKGVQIIHSMMAEILKEFK